MKGNRNYNKRKILSWIAVILWMSVIFMFSSQPATESGKLSKLITNIDVKIIRKVVPNTKFDVIEFEHIIRKSAHFFIYLGLSILIINTLRRSGVRKYRCIIGTLLSCIIFAASDELHQVFVAGRGAQVSDVIIDSAGIALGILLVTGTWKKRKIHKRSVENI